MDKSELSAQELPERKKKSGTNASSNLFYVKDIPKDVKMSDFVWEAPINLDLAIKLSKNKTISAQKTATK